MNRFLLRSPVFPDLRSPVDPDLRCGSVHMLAPLPLFGPSSYQLICESKRLNPDSQSSTPSLVDHSQRVLIVSGDNYFCSLVRSYLESSGLHVCTCSTPDRAETTFLNRCEIDLALIDVQSLGVGAVFFAMHFRESRPEVPLLIIEGARPDELVLKDFLFDSWTTVRKPVELPDLLATIHRLLKFGARRKSRNGTHHDRQPFYAPLPEDDLEDSFEEFHLIDAGLLRRNKSPN
jgi:CheY-like chemotaxis protein